MVFQGLPPGTPDSKIGSTDLPSEGSGVGARTTPDVDGYARNVEGISPKLSGVNFLSIRVSTEHQFVKDLSLARSGTGPGVCSRESTGWKIFRNG